jgi:8-oxo-dGTP pyrophosphatase MutT (NUDIX family)
MMNERIRELAEQAGIRHPVMGEVTYARFDYEKFAELIVRECMEQLVKEGDAWEQFSRNPPEGQETNASAALFAAYRLKEDAVARLEKHFGVEE